MAVLTVTGVPVSGAKYTVTTASSSDWASVSNGTYFFDLTDKLVYFKTSTGAITYGFNNSANRILRINNQIGTSYTLAIDDFNSDTITTMNNASANTVTVPPSVFPIGAQLLVAQEGLGQTSFVAGAGVTINAVGLSISSRYKSVALIQVALNEWDAYGTLDASLYTARTTAFASATAITDTTILNALNTFDLGLISNGLDTKMKAIYPMVGGTSTTCKYNFMDARDLDVAFRLQFFGGGTFSANGYQPNGINATANTFYNPSTTGLNVNSNHLSVYLRTLSNSAVVDIGQNNNQWLSAINFVGSAYIYNPNSTYSIQVVALTSKNLSINTRRSASDFAFFCNNVKMGTNATVNSSSFPSANVYISSAGGSSFFSERECAFSSIGDGLTDGEATTFYNLVQAMQVSLARAV